MMEEFMDGRSGNSQPKSNFTLSYALEAQSDVQWRRGFSTDTTLRLETPGTLIVYDSNLKETKRKWLDIGGTEGQKNTPLALVFGNSLSSLDSYSRSSVTVHTMPIPKRSDEECSMDLSLNFQYHQCAGSTASRKNPSVSAPKTNRTGLDLDLQLGSSVGLSESAVTGVTTAPFQHEIVSEKAIVLSQGPTLGDVSTSAFWRYGCCPLSHLTTSDIPVKANPAQTPDISSSKTDAPSNPGSCTSRMTVQRQKRGSSTKNCEVPGCVKGARGASGLCIGHGGDSRCQRAGCNKGAEGKTVYCKAHGGGRRCQKLGCTKSAEGHTDYCIGHGGGRRCSYEGCTRASRGKSGLCIKHGGGKRCQKENCTRSAEGQSGLCISYGGGRRCQYPICTKGTQGSTMLCKAHGGGKRCTFPECKKGAEGSIPFCKGHGGGKRCTYEGGCSKCVHGGTQFCGGKRCAVPDCTKSARGWYDFCVRHGGGKRCKSVGCDKSAQGRTDFCKAHGGGKKCVWGQPESGFGLGGATCGQPAKGKNGLCSAHNALVEDQRIHGGASLGSLTNPQMKAVTHEEDKFLNQKKIIESSMFTFHPGLASCPERRVHGGNLMAMLACSDAGLRTQSASRVDGSGAHNSAMYNPTAH